MDRTISGFFSGIVAGIMMNIWNLFDYYILHLSPIRFLDWFFVLLYWVKPTSRFELAFSLILQIIVWCGFMGVIFAHVVKLITARYIIFKSILYSMILWFIFKVIVNFYEVPVISGKPPIQGGMSNIFAIIIWGIVTGLMMKYFEKNKKSETITPD